LFLREEMEIDNTSTLFIAQTLSLLYELELELSKCLELSTFTLSPTYIFLGILLFMQFKAFVII